MKIERAVVLSACLAALASCHATQPASSAERAPALAERPVAGAPRVGFVVPESPPITLTASDGTGLRMRALGARVVIDGPLAFTELRLTFENPDDRTLEGTFRIALPSGASLGRFAMKVADGWQEGEVVELATARRAYEDFLHRKQDPALLEKAAGNEFSARVFPIPARGTKDLVVSYVEEVRREHYTLPLKGLPEVGSLDVEAHVAGVPDLGTRGRLVERGRAPAADFGLDLRTTSGAADPRSALTAVRSGDLALVRVRPETQPRPDPVGAAIVLVDTSASRVMGFESEVSLVGRIVAGIASRERRATVSIACFDQFVEPVFAGSAGDLGAPELAKIRDRGALGASDLERALVWAADAAGTTHARRVILVTDGVVTAGATASKSLEARVAALKAAGVERIDAVAPSGIRDEVMLQRLVRGHLGRDGVVVDGGEATGEIVRRLGEATRSGIRVKVEGATWSWPSKLDGVQSGDSFSVYVEAGAGELRVSIDGRPAEVVEARPTERPLLERAVAQARIESMLAREASADPSSARELRKAIVSLATRQRIMTPYTAMLVLETEADYARFGIDRRSLTDVLAIEDGAVKRVHRDEARVLAASVDSVVRVPEVSDDGPPEARSRAGIDRKEALARRDASLARREPRPAPTGAPANASPPPPPATAAASARPAERRRYLDAADPWTSAAPRGAASEPRAGGEVTVPRVRPGPVATRAATRAGSPDDDASDGAKERKAAYEGTLAVVMDQLRQGRPDEALATARAFRAEAPGDVLALVALGEAAEAKEMSELAARAYGSILDLFSNRADLRRFAGERLERVGARHGAALHLAIDTFEKAAADRPDHPSSRRLLTFALVRKGLHARAFDVAVAASRHGYEVDRYAGVDRILREDIGLVGAAWAKAEPARREEIRRRVRDAGGAVEDQPSLRFVLVWETDANDVDFHIHDARGGHAFYGAPRLPSGGALYADVTTGYGPECFTIRGPKARRAGPYTLEAHYYARGPMGYGMGKLEVIDYDGQGNFVFDERPFVVMADGAFVDLGTVR